MERDPPACVIHQWCCCIWWSVCGHMTQLTVAALCPQKPREGQMECWGKLHNWDQRLSSWQMRRQCYNYSSSGLFLFFHLPFISQARKRRPYVVSFVRTHSQGCASFCARVSTWDGASTAQKIPLKEIRIGLLCYSRLSGTLVGTYLSMSTQTAKNKLICSSPPSTLFFFFSSFVFLSLCYSTSISIWHSAFSAASSVFSTTRFHKTRHSPQNRPSFRPCRLTMKAWIVLHGLELYSASWIVMDLFIACAISHELYDPSLDCPSQ